MNHVNLKHLMNEAALKFAGPTGRKEALRTVSIIPNEVEKAIKPFVDILSSIKTDVRHVTYGSRSPIINEIDPLGDGVRGDHGSLSALFSADHTIRTLGNISRDIANQNVSGTYEALSQKTSSRKKPESALLFSIVTPNGSLRETDAYYRYAGSERGSIYFSVSFIKRKPNKQEWEKLKKLITHLHSVGNVKTHIRGAFIDFENKVVPTAFSITNKNKKETRIDVCDDKERNKRQANLEELIANLDDAYANGNPNTNFYIAGSFDI